ncbi:MAG: hypothetical protein JXO22_01900 [Phycisphaerae bacterium]|nr:hypothetical protein [Phycisphaerae bacterium]
MALSVVEVAVRIWLQSVYKVTHFGAIPTDVLILVPFIAACWCFVWPNRRRRPWAVPAMVVATALIVGGLMPLVEW